MDITRESICPYCRDSLMGIKYDGSCECSGLSYTSPDLYKFHPFGGIAVFDGMKFLKMEYVSGQHDFIDDKITA